MTKFLLLLHLLTAIFAVGPLVHAATTASRGLRKADVAALDSSSRMCKIYSGASLLVVVFGFGLMSQKSSRTHEKLASFGDTWIWLSLLLWVIAVGLAFGVIAPTLDKASDELRAATPVSGPDAAGTTTTSVSSYTARVAASGGVVGVLFAVIVVLMVYKPGS
ncbi:DUF2269 family protein [Flexivirga meconopsidis]|uniref:DUF2269 family protein n=1 Tax=Flexivirga meconopsidis TaxID=2977121 RepID=UPI0022405FDA|nr:hypothetical protein [Flexivirga meconopsidis]